MIKDKDGSDLLQLTVQGGPFVEADAPDSSNDHKWQFKRGAVGFLGVTGIINLGK